MLPLLTAAMLSAGDAGAVMKVKAALLIQAYSDNEIGADANYKGKALEVSGPVFAVGKNDYGNYYVAISTKPDWAVHCLLKENDPRAGSLKPGQKTTVTGTGDGLKRGEFNFVVLRDCRL
jgi:hypothetical protein